VNQPIPSASSSELLPAQDSPGPPAVAGGGSPIARAAATSLLLIASTLLCGLRLPAGRDRTLAFEPFGFVEGVLALVVLGLFLGQGIVARPARWMDRLALAYWFGATAVLLRLALPPPGIGYWIGTVIVAAALFGAAGRDDRRRTLVTLGTALTLCGMLRFAVIPFIWRHASLPDVGPFELGGLSDWVKGLVTDYQPVRSGNEILNVVGVALYALALRHGWPASPLLAGAGRQP
jgi:hypothetical protein